MNDEQYCANVLAKVHEFLDHEITEAEADAIREHLQACEPCLDHYDVEQAVKDLVRRCCGAERAPETLRVRVSQIMTVTGE